MLLDRLFICDAHGKFIDVEIEWSGSVHNACLPTVQFRKVIQPENTSYFTTATFERSCLPTFTLCNEKYDHSNSNEQVLFYTMLHSARNQTKYSFRRLKARWIIQNRAIDICIKYFPCLVLHNFFEKQKFPSTQLLLKTSL